MTIKDIKNTALQYLPFETEIAELDRQIEQLQGGTNAPAGAVSTQLRKLQVKQTEKLKALYTRLTPWQTVQVARHPQRPIFSDYLQLLFKDVRILHGDRCFGDDKAIITALGRVGREKVMIIGQNKGKDIKEKVACNFGCPNPEGYRKALAKMKLAEKFNLPVVALIDTPGAYPGVGAEERGQAQAIAVNLMEMSRLRVPVVCVVIGEGGSGGALAISVGDRLAILRHAYYSVISPEGCAAILWHDGTQAPRAAEALKLTGPELLKLKLVDAIIDEPLGGAHRNMHDTIYSVDKYIAKTLRQLKRIPVDTLLNDRYAKLRNIGAACLSAADCPPTAAKPAIPDRLSLKTQLDAQKQKSTSAAK